MNKRLWIVASLFGAIAVSPAMGDIVYTVNQTVGAGGVTGFIDTDGTIGTLATADLLDWNLTLNNGTSTANLLGPLSGNNSTFADGGDDLSATASLLQFNFNGDGSFMNFFNAGCTAEWSFQTTGSGSGCNGTTGNEEGVSAASTTVFAAESGEVTIGTASSVPEPSAFALTLIALLGVVFAARKRTSQLPVTRTTL